MYRPSDKTIHHEHRQYYRKWPSTCGLCLLDRGFRVQGSGFRVPALCSVNNHGGSIIMSVNNHGDMSAVNTGGSPLNPPQSHLDQLLIPRAGGFPSSIRPTPPLQGPPPLLRPFLLSFPDPQYEYLPSATSLMISPTTYHYKRLSTITRRHHFQCNLNSNPHPTPLIFFHFVDIIGCLS